MTMLLRLEHVWVGSAVVLEKATHHASGQDRAPIEAGEDALHHLL